MRNKRSSKGSLTIEAALILPAFMMALLTLSSALLMYLCAMRLQTSLITTAGNIAVNLPEGETYTEGSVRNAIAEGIDDEDARFIEGGRDGIELSVHGLDDGEYITLTLKCRLVPLAAQGLLGVPFERHCVTHCRCGYENGFFPDDEYVYITEDSSVYHRNRNCSHIMLSIRQTTAKEVTSLRNSSGARYKPCESCHSRLSDGRLYITNEGDRYHNSINCSGLKRTVRAVRLSEVGDRRPCSRCGR